VITRTVSHACYFPATARITSRLTNHINNLTVPDKSHSVITVEVQQT